jgi:hypothetical protein
MNKENEEIDGCIYCGSIVDLTLDHVPPKCLFESPRPSNLITVRCCSICNKRFGVDDEYFKTTTVLRWDLDSHPIAVARRHSALRAIVRRSDSGFSRLFTRTLESAPIVLPSGLYVEEGCRFEVDIGRIRSVVKRIVRGLHYSKTGDILPFGQEIIVLEDEFLRQADPIERKEILRAIYPMLQGEPEQLGDGVFEFFWRSQARLSSEWFIVFYSKIIYYAATAPSASSSAA